MPKRLLIHFGMILFLVVVAVAFPLHASAEPTTPEIEAKQAEASAARVELQAMNDRLEIEIETYNAVTEALALTQQRLSETEITLKETEINLSEKQQMLSGRAKSIYMSGETNILEVLLDAASFQDFLVRFDFAMRINRADAQAVEDVKAAKSALEVVRAALERQEAEEVVLKAEVERCAAAIEEEISDQKRYIAKLSEEIKDMIAVEEERLRREAEERARREAIERSQGKSTRQAADVSTLGEGHPEVVEVVLRYIGVPYQWGGASPSGFDCSGLCQYSYAEIGIALPRTSRAQYRAGQHIDRSRLDLLKPGDLVFFGTNGDDSLVHHVGIYIGNDEFIHAPHTGAVVRVESLSARIILRGDYVGASRL